MLSKKYSPNLGFTILFTAIFCCVLFVGWILESLSYEKAKDNEQKARQLLEASKYFLTAAQLDDDNINISRRYRCAGTTTCFNNEDKIKYYKLALKYNPNNKNAKNELKSLLNTIKKVEN